MERHFILPMTIAAALHAGLLFGIRSPHTPTEFVRSVLLDQFDPAPPIETPERIVVPNDESTPKSSVSEQRPELSEPTPLEHPSGPTIEIPVREPLTPTGPLSKIPLSGRFGPPGTSDGFPSSPLSPSLLDHRPHVRYQAQPVYPADAKRDSRTGEVVVEFTVDEAGLVVEPRVVRSTDRIFEEATLRAVAKWRFETGTRNGRAVRFRMMVPVVFSLSDG